jgi:hypothetical protein
VPILFGVPRYQWRQLVADATTTARASIGGDGARRFASALRVLWFFGYLRESWFGGAASPPIAFKPAEGR